MRWTAAQERDLAATYGRERAASIARRHGRTVTAVEAKAARLGLASKRKGSPLYANPANKGKTGPRGADHHAFRPVGAPWAAGGRMWVRLSADQTPRLYARVVAQRAGLNITGRVVVHLDGDSMNCAPDNLQALTRAEHVARNYGRCGDTELRTARLRMAKSGESFLDILLKGGFV
jgi:hypothetical protein